MIFFFFFFFFVFLVMKLGGKKENCVMENCASTDPGSRVDINEFIHPHFLLLHCSVKHD